MAVSVADTMGAITRVKRGRAKIIIVTREGAFRGDVNRYAARNLPHDR